MTLRTMLGVLAVSLLAAAAGCAPLALGPAIGSPPSAAKPAAGTPAPARAEPRREGTPAAAVTDSTPSRDALRVLASIPEPLPASQRVPPDSTRQILVPAPEAAYDTLRTGGATSEEGAGVPVPSPTRALQAPPVTFAPAESLAAPVQPPPGREVTPAAPSAPGAPGPAPAARKPGEPCWRLQISAPEERAKADSRRDAAQSLLLVPMVIEYEKRLYKVRTRDCMDKPAADALKRRAIDSGFDGAFVVNTAAPTPRPAAKAPAHRPARKPRRR